MVDVTTGEIVHTFATAEEAHVAVSGTGVGHFGNFKKVLVGDSRLFPHSIYKGYLFRLVGSHKLPPKGYRLKRRPTIFAWKGGDQLQGARGDGGSGDQDFKKLKTLHFDHKVQQENLNSKYVGTTKMMDAVPRTTTAAIAATTRRFLKMSSSALVETSMNLMPENVADV
jgi:hypothetical protein